ncbi:MmyB family transcriptional regulator [Kineococcus sp. SYSU DK001]|uniref:MmyB family transcriptional regulator n=1 Tax=Kineococcus sp. SYSU DK001 TaxID=3383122 RepID=UPI003D7D31CD
MQWGSGRPAAGDPAAATAHCERLVSCLPGVPAVVRDRYLDVRASNEVARRLSGAFEPGVNIARFTFLNPIVRLSTTVWEDVAAMVAGSLRRSLEEHLEDGGFRALVGELAARSDAFTRVWAADPAAGAGTGAFDLDHPVVGPLHLRFQDLAVVGAEAGTVMTLWYPTDPASARRLERLAADTDPGGRPVRRHHEGGPRR